MKKDYIPVTVDEPYKELKFVEEYWTRIWDSSKLNEPTDARLENSDQFKIMARYISDFPPNARILDGGCGLGQWTLFFTRMGFDVTGIDISQTIINRLAERFSECKFVVGDILSTKFEDEFFDVYYSWGAFEHIEIGLGPCFKEARRILNKGGYLFVSVPYENGRHLRKGKGDLSLWDENFHKRNGYTSSMRFYQYRLTKPELQREFEINGFKCLGVEAIAKKHGIMRFVKHSLNIDPGSLLCKMAIQLLYPFVPQDYVAHMIAGVGIKR